VVLALVGAAIVVLVSSWPPGGPREAPRSPGPTSESPAGETGAASAFVVELAADLDHGGSDRLRESAADAAAHRELVTLAENLDRLRVTDFSLRYLGESAVQIRESERTRFGDRAWVADVELSWRFQGVDRRSSTLDVPVVLAGEGGEPVFVTSRVAGGRRTPLWWQAAVVARRTPDTLVVAARSRRLTEVGRQAVAAVATVRATLPEWRGPLVVEVAGTGRQFRSASGLSVSSAQALAAVTTTTDGSGSLRSASHVYVNPPVFDRLGPRGQQIVMSHEAAHVALDAATTAAPVWLSEGIADYVALRDSEVPVRALTAQLRRLVRDEGAPAALPGPAKLDGGDDDTGAWYEAAWVAARLVADRHGEDALLELYRLTDEQGPTGRAFRDALGSTKAAFVETWRAELVRLAR
jgi:hypothetical protein